MVCVLIGFAGGKGNARVLRRREPLIFLTLVPLLSSRWPPPIEVYTKHLVCSASVKSGVNFVLVVGLVRKAAEFACILHKSRIEEDRCILKARIISNLSPFLTVIYCQFANENPLDYCAVRLLGRGSGSKEKEKIRR